MKYHILSKGTNHPGVAVINWKPYVGINGTFAQRLVLCVDFQASSAPMSTALRSRPSSSSESSFEPQAGDCSQAPAHSPLEHLADFQTWAFLLASNVLIGGHYTFVHLWSLVNVF